MKNNKRIEMIFDLLNTIDYDEHQVEIDNKCRDLLREHIKERKVELQNEGRIKKVDKEFWSDFLSNNESKANRLLSNKLRRFSYKSFYDHIYSE